MAVPPGISDTLPLRALGRVHDLDAFGLELVADAVGFRPVLGLLGLGSGLDDGVDLRIALALDDDLAHGLDRGGLLLLQGLRLGDEVEGEHIVKVGDGGQLGGVVGVGLEGVVHGGDGQGGVDVAVQGLGELLLEGSEGGLVHGRAIVKVQRNASVNFSKSSL